MFQPIEYIKKYRNKKSFEKKGGIFIEKIIYAVALFGPIITIPQVIKIWKNRDASDISIITWSGYFLFALIWISYGSLHKETPIVLRYALYCILYFLIVLGAILYG